MAQISISGDTSGTVTLAAPSVSGSSVLTLPVATDTLVGKATTDTLTNKTLGTGLVMGASVITSGTAVASTSGTSIDFTSIPSWVKRITVMFSGVSTGGTTDVLIQLGSGSIDATSYVGCRVAFSATNTLGTSASSTGIAIYGPNVATDAFSGVATIALLGSNTWSASGTMGASAPRAMTFGFSKTLSGTLDRIRITTVNGIDAFDAGSINILYE